MTERADVRVWILSILLTLLAHVLLLPLPIQWRLPSPPAPVDLQQFSPQQLEALRQKWNQLGLNLSAKSNTDTPPENARYYSDRNQEADREQRARDGTIHARPQPKSPGKSQSNQRKVPLSQLGVPVRTEPAEAAEPRQERSQFDAEERGEQKIGDEFLPEGNENLLNTREATFYSFNARVYGSIAPYWQQLARETLSQGRITPGTYEIVPEVIYDDQGHLQDIRILKSSGIARLDRDVVDAWRKFPDFPNPPSGMLESDGNIHLIWRFTVEVVSNPETGDSDLFNFSPPKRLPRS